jgi:hypothetical protein
MRLLACLGATFALACLVGAAASGVAAAARPLDSAGSLCSSSFVAAVVGGVPKCLRAGEFCSAAAEPDYEKYGFTCTAGHLERGTSPATPATPATPVFVGQTVLIAPRTETSHCRDGPNPDPRCSPGAYSSGLTKAVLCSPSFRTGSIRNVPVSEKHADEIEYGMAARPYGRTIEIDHIISLELGGSNNIANLFPEPGSGPANYHVKDRLENRLHALVCAGSMTLRAAQVGIASHWQLLYQRVFGVAPAG